MPPKKSTTRKGVSICKKVGCTAKLVKNSVGRPRKYCRKHMKKSDPAPIPKKKVCNTKKSVPKKKICNTKKSNSGTDDDGSDDGSDDDNSDDGSDDDNSESDMSENNKSDDDSEPKVKQNTRKKESDDDSEPKVKQNTRKKSGSSNLSSTLEQFKSDIKNDYLTDKNIILEQEKLGYIERIDKLIVEKKHLYDKNKKVQILLSKSEIEI